MKVINKQKLQDIVRGAVFLGSGGGGAYETGMQIAGHFDPEYYGCKEIKVVTVEEVKSLTTVKYGVMTAVIGAPERMKEIKNAEMNVQAVKKLAEIRGIALSEIGCIVPGEIGAISTAIACVTAAKLGIPVLNGDGAGRAVPVLNMTTFAVNGVSVNPTVLVGSGGDHVAFNISKEAEYSATSSIESLARPVLGLPEFNGMAALAMWLVDLEKMDEVITIRDTLTKCKVLGEVIRQELEEVQTSGNTPSVENLLHTLQDINYKPGFVINGILRNAATTTAGGFDHGIVEVAVDERRQLKIIYQNESLLLWDSEEPAPFVVAPDLISYLIEPAGHLAGQWVYTNGDIVDSGGKLLEHLKNARITIIGMRAPKELRDCADELEALRQSPSADGVGVSLQDSYRSMLEKLNYYGKYEPLKPGIG